MLEQAYIYLQPLIDMCLIKPVEAVLLAPTIHLVCAPAKCGSSMLAEIISLRKLLLC